jgi:hypothetical protein
VGSDHPHWGLYPLLQEGDKGIRPTTGAFSTDCILQSPLVSSVKGGDAGLLHRQARVPCCSTPSVMLVLRSHRILRLCLASSIANAQGRPWRATGDDVRRVEVLERQRAASRHRCSETPPASPLSRLGNSCMASRPVIRLPAAASVSSRLARELRRRALRRNSASSGGRASSLSSRLSRRHRRGRRAAGSAPSPHPRDRGQRSRPPPLSHPEISNFRM